MKALNTGFLRQQMEEVDTICQNFLMNPALKETLYNITFYTLHLDLTFLAIFMLQNCMSSTVLRLQNLNLLMWLLLLYHPFKSKLNLIIILEVHKSRMFHIFFAELKTKSA